METIGEITPCPIPGSGVATEVVISNYKKRTCVATDYLDKMKGIVDALEAIAQPISEFDLSNQILNGLGPEYDVVHTSIANRKSPISFEELFGQLLTFEPRLELHNSTSIITTPLYTSTSHGRSVLMDGLLTVVMVVILPPTLVVALFLNPLHIRIPIPLHLHVRSVIALGNLPLIVSIDWISLSKCDNHERNSRL